MSRTDSDLRYLRIAYEVSKSSPDPSTKTGACIVRPRFLRAWHAYPGPGVGPLPIPAHTVVAAGCNRFPAILRGDADLYADREAKYSRIVHCEVNALIAAKEDVRGCTLYTWPFISCDRCCVQMLSAGIAEFVAPTPTPDQESRWGDAFAKTRAYCAEANVSLREYPRDRLMDDFQRLDELHSRYSHSRYSH